MNTKTKSPKLNLTPLESLEQAAECLKTLAHPHRLRIVQMLLQGRYTVGELAEACEILNTGFARNPWIVKTGIQLPKMIVTTTHSESGCHENSMLFRRQVCQSDLVEAFLF